MKIYPVIMCGGSGARLWPASRPSRPKQFIPLSGNRSLFQDTALRVAPLADGGGRLIVVAGVSHRQWVIEQLDEIGVEAHVLLEPEARDSAAAMAAAAAWTERADRAGVNAFVASDHHIPDEAAFQDAVRTAAESAAKGRVVTLGVKPTGPASAYGYIKPTGPGLSAVRQFIEKPDAVTAAEYIRAGYLWNSGNFVVSAKTLLSELAIHAPAVARAARAALPAPPRVQLAGTTVEVLGGAFTAAPKVSIDYALMETTNQASVLEVHFDWSDLGAWDAIEATGEGDTGLHLFEDAEGCLARASDGMMVVALGVKNLAIIAEKDAVLVCDLSRAQDVKRIVERLKVVSPQHVDFKRLVPESLAEGGRRFADWMRLRALPLWSTLGMASDGTFAEVVSLDGRGVSTARRARVQARQIYVFAQAGLLGWSGPWRRCVDDGVARLISAYLRDDGLCRALLGPDGAPLDETAAVYDQAFVMLALATAKAAGSADDSLEARAVRIRDHLLASASPNGAVKGGEDAYQSNCHMHLLEACLAWEDCGGDARWAEFSDRIVELARTTFIDGDNGFIREFFGPDWKPAAGDAGRLVEPGHQFEWAWLLARYGRARGDAGAMEIARSLFAHGVSGVSELMGVVVDAMNEDGSVRSRRARLWPQTEWMKAALILAETSQDGERRAYLDSAAAAQRALWFYLTDDGLWRDKRLPDRDFIDEPAPASSFYHIMAAFRQLSDTSLFGSDQTYLPALDLR
jgi:mannose-1-phosphate guanylyltransferase/mannose-6-phosphate isomerase